MEIERISELVEGAALFDSRGYSTLKVTKDGQSKLIKIPIKSTGVAEFQEKLSSQAPKPPVIAKFYRKGSPEAKALGSNQDVKAIEFDFTDPEYIEANDKHTAEWPWRVCIFAIDLPWKKSDGTVAETYEEKKRILQSNGITGHHIDKLLTDVTNLTKIAEDQEDFLSES
jgi:hypothetical protein